jgi:outer membrane receptor protein involved in Fe transport
MAGIAARLVEMKSVTVAKALLSLILGCGAYVHGISQVPTATVSGMVHDKLKVPLPYVNVLIKTQSDSVFVAGTVTDDRGLFSLPGIPSGNYVLELSYVGHASMRASFLVGRLSTHVDLGRFEIAESPMLLSEVAVVGQRDAISETMEKKVFQVDATITQSGGSLLQVMRNLPGVTVSEDGTVQLRGSDKVTVLVDGRQTALTGFGTQKSLDNIPASAIEQIEVINNPSSKYDANGNAGIINIIYRKDAQEGFNGKAAMTAGLGALWIKRENYPGIRPQYTATPKINPSLSLNYRRKRSNLFLQVDDLYTQTLNKNEFTDRYYDNGDTIKQQLKRNRNTNIVTSKGGVDWYVNDRNTASVSALFSSEKIIDRGDEPFYNSDLSEMMRLWQFLEDELKTTITATGTWQHRYARPGRTLSFAYNYTFHREDEKYFFTNTMPTYTGEDSFALISDEQVSDVTVDYIHPMSRGRFETGVKFRARQIPTDMTFYPGINSPLDVSAGGKATYHELIPAIYGNYVFESKYLELEGGLRIEYAKIDYEVDPGHPTYESDGYDYAKPFPNLRIAYKINPQNTLSLFYNSRVDRPNEVDIRVFPKYDDAEIIKVGNPALQPQFTNSVELGYKRSGDHGYLYAAGYHKRIDGTIIRIASIQPGSALIYNVFQNAGNSRSTGAEIIVARDIGNRATFNLNLNGYHNVIDSFTVVNQYPAENTFTTGKQDIFSGSVKFNGMFHLRNQVDIQVSMVYAAPDVVPQGKTYSRIYADFGAKKVIQNGKGEIFVNASDIANTLRIKREVFGDGFHYVSTDYLETQVIRMGYNFKF